MLKYALLALLSAAPLAALKAESIYHHNDLPKNSNGFELGKPAQNVAQVVPGEPLTTIGKTTIKGQEARENTKPFSRVSLFSDPARFQAIKTDDETAADEIDFWARQMSEHALFFYLGFVDGPFKDEALALHKTLEKFRREFNKNQYDAELTNSLLPLLERERDFQIRVLKALDSGKWIGWIFPLFVNHTTLELDYFVDKLNDIKYSPQDEVLFWNRINSEHAAFASHLLDPSERELFLKADKLSTEFDAIPKSEREMMIRLSLMKSKELDQFNKTARAEGKQVKSVIHPVLLDHVIREGERSVKTLSALNLPQESLQFAHQYAEQIQQYQPEAITA
jgi:hypothetical protein